MAPLLPSRKYGHHTADRSCPGFYDEHGQWSNGFHCPQWGGPEREYCCGTETYRFCCPREDIQQEPSGKHVENISLAVGLSLGSIVLVLFAVVMSCYFCRCCWAYKRRKRHSGLLPTCPQHPLVSGRQLDYAVNYSVCPHGTVLPEFMMRTTPPYPMDEPPPYPGEPAYPLEEKQPLRALEVFPNTDNPGHLHNNHNHNSDLRSRELSSVQDTNFYLEESSVDTESIDCNYSSCPDAVLESLPLQTGGQGHSDHALSKKNKRPSTAQSHDLNCERDTTYIVRNCYRTSLLNGRGGKRSNYVNNPSTPETSAGSCSTWPSAGHVTYQRQHAENGEPNCFVDVKLGSPLSVDSTG